MKEKTVESHDGIQLKYAISETTKGQPWLALVMPFGLKLKMSKNFFDFFQNHYNIVSLESRLILSPEGVSVMVDKLSVDNHAKDLLTVLSDCEIEECDLIGYCSGAGVSLSAVNMNPGLFRTLILAHGEYTLLEDATCTTPFALDIDSLLTLAAKNEQALNSVYEKVHSERFYENSHIPEGIDNPFSQKCYLQRYALNYTAYKSTDFKNLASAVKHKTLVMTGRRDVQANVESSKTIQRLIKNADIYVDSHGDHYGLVREDSNALVTIWNYLIDQGAYLYA